MPTGAVGADSDGTSLPLPMTSSSEAGLPSDGMPAASPPAALTVVLPASDACVSQKARGYVLQVGAHCHVRASTRLLVSKRRRRRRELEHELVTGGRHELEFELVEHVDRVPAARGGMHAKERRVHVIVLLLLVTVQSTTIMTGY